MTTRIIETGISNFDAKAKEILDSVIGQMSDGIWENSNCMNAYWMCANVTKSEYELALDIDNRYYYPVYGGNWIKNRYYDMTDDKILEFFARKIDQIIKVFKQDNTDIKITDDTECDYLGYKETITIGDAKKVRKALLNEAKNIRSLTTK